MIISHKHKFIFFKPWKVAGNSVEYNLIKHCGDNDLIDSTHRNPKDTLDIIGKRKFNKYFKFTIARNPWDRIVSYFWWKDGGLVGENHRQNVDSLCKMNFDGYEFKEHFARFVGNYKHFNEPFYFNEEGEKIMDFYMKYERIATDYKKLCRKLKIPHEPLRQLGKFPFKKKNEKYWKYYNHESGSVVSWRHRKTIEMFNYACGPKPKMNN